MRAEQVTGPIAYHAEGPVYRVTRYGHRVMTAAIVLHDDRFADHYTRAA